MRYRIKYQLTHTVRMNWKNDKRYTAENFRCPDCLFLRQDVSQDSRVDIPDSPSSGQPTGSDPRGQPEVVYRCAGSKSNSPVEFDTQFHLSTSCTANSDLREGRDLNSHKGIVNFFCDVIERRKTTYEC